MLSRSLCCFRGISPDAERKLWRAGCLAWEGIPGVGCALSVRKREDLACQLPAVRAALKGRVGDFFLKRLPVGYRVRLLPEFADGIGFLDVESTGLGPRDELTVIGLWRNGRMMQFVKGHNLEGFLEEWRQIEVLVTFNGPHFDWPMLARCFGITREPPHIDLMAEARVYGYSGGLKVVERMAGVVREASGQGDGAEAVTMWHRYHEMGDAGALRRLLTYNECDVVSLVRLSAMLWRRWTVILAQCLNCLMFLA